MSRNLPFLLLVTVVVAMSYSPANALPAFARRYNVDCITCHTIPPRLNNFGMAFMRRGFKMQWDEKLNGQKVQDYASIQTNVDYVSATGQVPASTLTDTQVALFSAGPLSPQLSYYGELDYNPDPAVTQFSIHEFKAEIFFPVKVDDTQEKYWSVFVGAIRPFSTWQKELNEARTVEAPFIFSQTPFQAQGVPFSFIPDDPQYGAEVSYNIGTLTGQANNTYISAAILNGLQVNGAGGPSGLTPNQNGSADLELQLAHFFGARNSVSLMYYTGSTRFFALDNPGGDVTQFPALQNSLNGTLTDQYSRIFLNGNYSPNKHWDFIGGLMVGNDSANIVDGTAAATNGGYAEVNYYFPNPKYVLIGRYDTMNLAAGQQGQTTNGLTFAVTGQVFKNILVTLEHSFVNNTDGSQTGTTIGDVRFIW